MYEYIHIYKYIHIWIYVYVYIYTYKHKCIRRVSYAVDQACMHVIYF